MKIFITLAALIIGLPLFIQTKSLLEKPFEASQQESYARSCRKRKTKKNRAVYRASSPATTDITEQKSHPIITPKGHKKQENCSSGQSHAKKKSVIKKEAPVNADVTYPGLQSKADGVEPIALAQTRTQNNQKENKSSQTTSPIPTMESPLDRAEIALNKQEAPISQPDTRTITVKNGVTKKMRTYKHWGTSHEPTFTLRANGIEIPQKGQAQITLIDNELKTDYHADFYGMRTSSDKANFIVDADTSEITITFGWDKNPRIIIDGATVMQEK